MIEFTAFAHNAYPTKSVVVDTLIRSVGHYGKQQLNDFAAGKQWSEGCVEHLSELLDAIVNDELISDD
ncbi:MAG: hypothetical protein JWP89_6935 [Schlesneria sp.]|nr:hypothetical protein [Schlesneria sp.]